MGTVRDIRPVGPVHARVRVPGSKSITNRALICAALARGRSVLQNASDSEDTLLMINGLNQLGVLVTREDDALIVEGTGGKLYAPKYPIPVGNAGTTLRFLLSVATLAQGTVMFQTHPRMADRPNDDLLDALRSLGAVINHQARATTFTVHGGSMGGGAAHIKGDRSSQFLSSLLMVAPYATHDVELIGDGALVSAPYIDMTIDLMRQFGVEVGHEAPRCYRVRSGEKYHPVTVAIEPDASSASYFLGAAAITGGSVLIDGMRRASLQGDAAFVDILSAMGCRYQETAEGLSLTSTGALRGIDVDMNAMPDMVPTLVAVALFAQGETRIRNVGHLRYKESDRGEGLVTELHRLGGDVGLQGDTLVIRPTGLHGGQLDTYEDHRLVMSFALVGLQVPGVSIEQPESVRKSFPGFWDQFVKLYSVWES
jgi:3-phosphoshikimate 1-carboxyvinyltransferase